ncbi:uncharacterized protein LOC116343427 [Contarinia nasturtii]|uniref:uncharacterized protein LOC116343427 n=1 Tax=Contarinia nasturtii TaxID=265458 RepID=UPI0012D46688|nr:uncharacterized protein LOC116343427 [Contarinia nasturtii]
MEKSDLSQIPTQLIRDTICELIEAKLNTKNYEVTVSSASKEGENNFVGVVYRVSFNKTDDTNSSSKLIVKVAPQNVTRRTQFRSRNLFLQEIYMYNEVLPSFRQFEGSKGVTAAADCFSEYPKCFKTIDDEPSECVLLEDLSARDLSIIDRYSEEVTADHVYLVMSTLGKFHAISFALKDQKPEKFHELASKLKEMFIDPDDPMFRMYYEKFTESIFKVLGNEEDVELLAKMKKLFERHSIDIAADCLNLEMTGSASVISYGDSWQNNIMFGYDMNKKPKEACFLDWQISRHSSPIIDIVYFMFCCTTKELRDAHYDDFLKAYHDSLSAHIRRLGSDPEKLFPFPLMQEHFRKCGKYGLIMAAVLLPMITMESGNGIDLDEAANSMAEKHDTDAFDDYFISVNSRNKFNKRMRDVVADMIRLGYV